MTTTVDQALPSFPEPNEMGGWSFLQALTTPSNGDDVVYVHPLVKRSRSPLTEKGLEMCTESLGSETGSDAASFDFPVSLPEPGPSVRARARVREETATVRRELPPPLPSISGVHVECVREGGRLVMRAVTVGPAHACFEAQRDNGRLTLRFTESCATGCESYQEAEEEEEDCEGKDTDGIYEEVEGNTYATASTSSRCNEEESTNRDMLYAEAFWVATS